ncbi:MAG: hypothetical protein C0507_15840 [Cyanobacteria bacterium PR.3.49]|nr:hypothetical protein [Cyanobacteria bacterium PR.3.49]
MSCKVHGEHDHKHGDNCGHQTIKHGDHDCYLHDGHMHHMHGDHVDDHTMDVGGANASSCTPSHDCSSHDKGHKHGAGCGHEGVPHGDHTDYLVGGHLHSPCGDHCDDHGAVSVK